MSIGNILNHTQYVPLENGIPETPSDPDDESNPIREYASDLMIQRMIGFTPKQGIACVVVCCVGIACTLSALAVAFFAAGGSLVNNPDESMQSVGTSLLIGGGVATAICVTKCCIITRCFIKFSRQAK